MSCVMRRSSMKRLSDGVQLWSCFPNLGLIARHMRSGENGSGSTSSGEEKSGRHLGKY